VETFPWIISCHPRHYNVNESESDEIKNYLMMLMKEFIPTRPLKAEVLDGMINRLGIKIQLA
jgi:hypothetical protein